jgi:hypothetical protein
MIQATSVTGSRQADELRREMADGLVAEGWIKSPHVEAAFRSVPRHLLMPPGTPLETAYNGHRAPVLKTRDNGVNLSSPFPRTHSRTGPSAPRSRRSATWSACSASDMAPPP